MALPGSGIVNQGLQRIGINASAVGGSGAVQSSQTVTRYLMTMAVDDNSSNFAATDTAQNTRGALINFLKQAFDAFPTRTSQTISHVMTITSSAFDTKTVKGIAIHDDTTANVSASSSTLSLGIAGQSALKTANVSMALTITILYTDNS